MFNYSGIFTRDSKKYLARTSYCNFVHLSACLSWCHAPVPIQAQVR